MVDKRCTATFEKACSEVTENVCATVIDIKNEQVSHQIIIDRLLIGLNRVKCSMKFILLGL